MSRAGHQGVISGMMRDGAEKVLARVQTLADEIDQLASRVNTNSLSRVNPETFHAERSDIALCLRRIARKLRGDTRREPSTVWRA